MPHHVMHFVHVCYNATSHTSFGYTLVLETCTICVVSVIHVPTSMGRLLVTQLVLLCKICVEVWDHSTL